MPLSFPIPTGGNSSMVKTISNRLQQLEAWRIRQAVSVGGPPVTVTGAQLNTDMQAPSTWPTLTAPSPTGQVIAVTLGFNVVTASPSIANVGLLFNQHEGGAPAVLDGDFLQATSPYEFSLTFVNTQANIDTFSLGWNLTSDATVSNPWLMLWNCT